MADQDDKDYEVGYGKPPKHTQFQPGQSGNPAGRPPKSRNLKRLVDEVLDEKIELTENGLAQTMSKREDFVPPASVNGACPKRSWKRCSPKLDRSIMPA
jgi:hypothetical protein